MENRNVNHGPPTSDEGGTASGTKKITTAKHQEEEDKQMFEGSSTMPSSVALAVMANLG